MFTTDKAEIMRIAKKIAWDTAHVEIPEEDELHMSEVDALNLLGRDGAFELIRYTYRIYKAHKRISKIINECSIPEDDDLLSSEMIALQDLGKNTLDLICFAYIYGYARGRAAQ